MKFLHLADLHLGKRLGEFSLLEDQQAIWSEICTIITEQSPDVIVIAGDCYDKSIPPVEAVSSFDTMLCQLAAFNIPILIIYGNHDSPTRLAFGGKLMQENNVYISPVFDGEIMTFSAFDNYGEVCFYLLPYIRPATVRALYPEEEIDDFNDAVRVVLEHTDLNPTIRNVLVTHQYVEGATLYGTEERSVGGSDMVSADLFTTFDYTALGHLHKPQYIGVETIRYAGSPLKYSVSEAAHDKSVTLVELHEKGNLQITQIPLHPRHDLRLLRGTYVDIVTKSNNEGDAVKDYVQITLTDETDIPDVVGRLRTIYPNLLGITYDNTRTRQNQQILAVTAGETMTPDMYFSGLYELQNNQPLTDEQRTILQKLTQEIWENHSD